ncbi:glycosyltransferase family 4 protein [Sphingobacterium sp. LRF_L2]|uniref:glycosyltransferase family 4 protein n=1 Tax=Sphingobacterium sp. LRF_L2 TaxID=3369421 RepID=UPI003F61B5C5
MKIVYCISATHNSGGMERVLTNKANYLVKAGHEVHVITTDQQGKPSFFELDPRVQCNDIGINYVESQQLGLFQKLLQYAVKQKKHQERISALLCYMKPDVTISMFDHDVPFLWKIQDGSAKILEVHFSRFKRLQYGRKGLWKLVDRWRSRQDLRQVAQYTRFVVLTQEDKGYWGALPNIQVIPNAHSFEPDSVANLADKRAIAVGRLDHQKNFEELVYAWVRASKACPDWVLHIFGKGPMKEQLEGLIRDLGLQDTVYINAPVKDITKEYLNSALLAMTSRYEGLPMALLEAQACGLPLVAYACKCGPRDIIQNGENGFLIKQGDREELTEHLILLMQDSILRKKMGAKAKALAANFTEEHVMRQWLDLFEIVRPKVSNASSPSE